MMTSADHSTHPDDALADLATGADVDAATLEHVAGCTRCTDELAVLRTVADLVREPVPALVEPPAHVWDAVRAEIGLGGESFGPAEPRQPVPSPAGPAVDPVPSGEAEVVPLAARRGPRRVAAGWLLAAAAAGVVVGGLGAPLLDRADPASSPEVVAQASLDALDTGQALGAAQAVRVAGHLDLALDTPVLDPGEGYLEVWLINRDLRRMVSVGVLRPGEQTQRFAIDEALIEQGYVIVDISREGFDEMPEHSGDSVVRGTLPL